MAAVPSLRPPLVCTQGWNYVSSSVPFKSMLVILISSCRRPSLCFTPCVKRCSHDTILATGNYEYGPTAFSFYKGLPPSAAKRIFIINGDAEGSFDFCTLMVARLKTYLIAAYPLAIVEVFPRGTVHEDFFRWNLCAFVTPSKPFMT